MPRRSTRARSQIGTVNGDRVFGGASCLCAIWVGILVWPGRRRLCSYLGLAASL